MVAKNTYFNPGSVIRCIKNNYGSGNYSLCGSERRLLLDYFLNNSVLKDSLIKTTKKLLSEGGLSNVPASDLAQSVIPFNNETELKHVLYHLLISGLITDIENPDGTKLLRIPNEEARMNLMSLLEDIEAGPVDIQALINFFEEYLLALKNFDVPGIRSKFLFGLKQMFPRQLSQEAIYHCLVQGFTFPLNVLDVVTVDSEAGAGGGLADLALHFEPPYCATVIFEFKYARNVDQMEHLAREGLKQIIKKAYTRSASKSSRILCIGCAFSSEVQNNCHFEFELIRGGPEGVQDITDLKRKYEIP